MSRHDLMNGGQVYAAPSVESPGLVYLELADAHDIAAVLLTGIEAIGLAQMLLKAANAEVQS